LPVRSKRLAYGATSPTALTNKYTVPSGHTTIVKGVTVVNGSSAGSYFVVAAVIGGGTAVSVFACGNMSANAVVLSSELWHVLEAGDVLQVVGAHSDITFYISGAELDGVA